LFRKIIKPQCIINFQHDFSSETHLRHVSFKTNKIKQTNKQNCQKKKDVSSTWAISKCINTQDFFGFCFSSIGKKGRKGKKGEEKRKKRRREKEKKKKKTWRRLMEKKFFFFFFFFFG